MVILGLVGSLLFIASAAAQAVHAVRNGNARGISHIMLAAVNIGMICMLLYAIFYLGDPILTFCCAGQAICWFTVTKYKYLESKEK